VPLEVPPEVSDRTVFNYDRSVGDRIVTWPNALSAARLAGVPVFLWLVLGPRSATGDIIAAALLGLAGISDWLDGKLARMLNQTSRLGQLLDPAADRLYIGATIIALAVRGIIPWWLFVAIVAREACMVLALVVLRSRTDYGALQVSFVGKAATLCLMYGFPLLFLGAHGGYFDLTEKYPRFKAGDRNAFIDPAGYKAYIADREQAFETELKKQFGK